MPHTAADARLLRVLPFADWQAADADQTTYRISSSSLARAAAAGWSSAALWETVQSSTGPLPPEWQAGLHAPTNLIRIESRIVLTVDDPAVLARAASQSRSVRRYLNNRLAPGIALIAPEQVRPLARALQRNGCAASITLPEAPVAPTSLSSGDCATLLVACAFYRDHAPSDAPLLPDQQLEDRLRAALPHAVRVSTNAALVNPTVARPPATATPWQPTATPLPPPPQVVLNTDSASVPSQTVDDPPPVTDTLRLLRQTIAARQVLNIRYTTEAGDHSQRTIRPLEIEQRYGDWYLRAYGTLRHAERTFRIDRISAIEPTMNQRQQRPHW